MNRTKMADMFVLYVKRLLSGERRMNMWVIEDYDSIRKVCATKEIALREVIKMLRDFYNDRPDDTQELEDYRELMKQYFDPSREDFYIDEFCWVYKAEYIDK